MQDVTPWPESFDVSEPVARVLVDGREANVESVTVSAELDSAMPERVAGGGGGVVAATGTASILRVDDVAESGFNPWGDAQRLVNASEVVVEAGYRHPDTGAVGCARQITGQVQSMSGGALSNAADLNFVDHTPTLDRNITIEPLMQNFPPTEDNGLRRGAGLSSLFITDRVLRHCGFYATPPMIPGALLSATLMGSSVPERGTLRAAWSESNDTQAAAFRPIEWGMGLGNGSVRYTPDLSSRSGRMTSTMHVSFLRSPRPWSEPPRTGRIELLWGNAFNAIRILIMDDDRLIVQYREDGNITTVATLPPASVNASEAFTVLIRPSGQATIYASNGATASGTAPLPPLTVSTSMTEILAFVPRLGYTIGGLQVANSGSSNHMFERNAHIGPALNQYPLRAFPSKIDVNCLSLLREQAEAELAAMWIDEYGHFHWRNRDQLRNSSPVGTLTSKDDLLDLPWEIPVRSVYSRVEVEHDIPVITQSQSAAVTVSDNRGSTLSNGESEDRFFEPPADQDWHLVEAPQWMGGTVDYHRLRRGRGSYHGGIVADDDNNERLAYSSRLDQTWSQIGPQRWLLSSQAHNLASNEYIEQSLRDRPDLYGRFANENLPIIRARGLVQWEREVTTGTSRGPALAPTYVHSVGPWVQWPEEITSLADLLAEYLTKPDVILRRIPIVPDPRVQLGDVFWLEDQTAYQVRLRIVVMGKTLKYQVTNSGHEMTQEITCRVIDVERLGVRYDELEATWDGRDYAALESAWYGQDYDAFEANPLDRS